MEERKANVKSRRAAQYLNQVIVKDYLRYLSFNELLFDGYNKRRNEKIKIEFRVVWAVYDTLCELENRFISKDDRKKDDKSFYNSHKAISILSGLSMRSMISGINILEKFGIIQVIRSKDSYNRNKINNYILIDGINIKFRHGFEYNKETGEYTNIAPIIFDSATNALSSATNAPYSEANAQILNKELINKDKKEREREESLTQKQTLEITQTELDEATLKLNGTIETKSEQSINLSELARYKKRFATLLKQEKFLPDDEIAKMTMTEGATEDLLKRIKERQKFDNDKRLSDFDEYARNYFASDAACYLPNGKYSFHVFLKFYEKFKCVQRKFNEHKTDIQKKEEHLEAVYKG